METIDLPVPLLPDQPEIGLGRAMRELRMSHVVASEYLDFSLS